MTSKHRNSKLEQKIVQHKSSAELDLENNELVDQDMEIVAKQALRENKVRSV